MKTVPVALQNHLEQEVTTLATCWRLTLRDSTVKGFTSHSTDLTIADVVYSSRAGYTPTAVQTTGSLAVDNLDVEGILAEAGISQSDVDAGRLDYAEVLVFIVNYKNLTDSPPETVIMRRGHLGQVRIVDGRYIAEIRGLMQNLQQTIGETYGFTCPADFGSQEEAPMIRRCGFDLATVTVTGTITAVDDRRIFSDAGRGEGEDYFTLGKLTWLTGLNAGRSMEIKGYLDNLNSPDSPDSPNSPDSPPGGTFVLVEPMASFVQVGDTYSAHPGCDKRPVTCKDRWDNFVNYRGHPYVIGDDDAVRMGEGGGGSGEGIF